MSMELTLDELADLYMLCEREADQFDYDKEVHVRFTELAEKLSAIIRVKKVPHHMMSCYANKTGRENDCNCADWGTK